MNAVWTSGPASVDTVGAEPFDPLGDGLGSRVMTPRGFRLRPTMVDHLPDHSLSTFWRKTGILVNVHSALLKNH